MVLCANTDKNVHFKNIQFNIALISLPFNFRMTNENIFFIWRGSYKNKV